MSLRITSFKSRYTIYAIHSASLYILGKISNTRHTDDRQRAKATKRIFATHKVFDKKTGGYFNGR
ncbi:MAG: hypothetical protein QM487_10400 [Candidatus Marithrix sp.]